MATSERSWRSGSQGEWVWKLVRSRAWPGSAGRAGAPAASAAASSDDSRRTIARISGCMGFLAVRARRLSRCLPQRLQHLGELQDGEVVAQGVAARPEALGGVVVLERLREARVDAVATDQGRD